MEKLKPCPFCGFKARIKKFEKAIFDKSSCFYVKCYGCGACGSVEFSEDGAIDMWNRRAENEQTNR